MLDLLASTGTVEILEYIRKNPEESSSVKINQYFTKIDTSEQLTTATIYRRLKELELAGFIMRQPPDSNTFILAPQAIDILDQQINKHPEITELKRSHRALLREIKQREGVGVVELQQTARMSPTTINVGLQKLDNLGLIERIKNHVAPSKEATKKSKKAGPGRPLKRIKLKKKGKEVYEELERLSQE
ncbi:MAG: hypothetical protein ACXADY_18000 [Candidatus Hodarchaeales archaeon]|jgi:DNA-binding HxlR family transcriptional regulator